MRASRTRRDDAMLPQLERRLRPVEPMTEEQVLKVDDASMDILEEVGVVFRDPIALADWSAAGAKALGAQAGYESAATMMAVLHAGADYVWHAAGWNEGGLHCSMAKFVVDAEVAAMGHRMASGLRWDDFDEALAAVRDVGPGGHYLGHPHTLERFQEAFFMPELFDNNSIEQWTAEGSQEITARALDHARELLADYEEPVLEVSVAEALREYVARREREIPAAEALNQEF